ncbi:MAG: hypothetical protein A2Z08_11875 [Deltaproteobacteria bacterium RBG_16_54_11]|nr:MAG: hypothetical protein A2Z08_11875 [Deltaproteobacteria bacterium RBG_16_54_11]
MPLVNASGQFIYVQSISNRTVTLDKSVTGLLLPSAYVVFEDEKQIYRILNILPPNDTLIELTDDILGYIGTQTFNIRLYRLGAITYQINGDSLVRNNQPLAGDGTTTVVEDLQIAYGVWNNTAAPPRIDWSNTPPGGSTEMVRITIILRTAVPDPQDTSFFKPAKEDNAQDNANPGCRRRVYTTEVMLRNLK